MRQIQYSPEAKQKLVKIKNEVSVKYGEEKAKNILIRITKNIRNLEIFPEAGSDVSEVFEVKCDYRYIYAEKNYIFYRIEDKCIKVVTILNERQDFMQILFGIKTMQEETEEYWNE